MQNPEETPEEEETGTGEDEVEAKTDPVAEGSIKVVINLKGNRATVGVQAPGCDPVFGMVEGNRDEIAQAALRILGQAEEKWKTTPQYPKSEVKAAPAPAPTPARTASSPAKAQPSKAGAPLF